MFLHRAVQFYVTHPRIDRMLDGSSVTGGELGHPLLQKGMLGGDEEAPMRDF
jgi:hypothetical protein